VNQRVHILRDAAVNESEYMRATLRAGYEIEVLHTPQELFRRLHYCQEQVDCLVIETLTTTERVELLVRLRSEIPADLQPLAVWLDSESDPKELSENDQWGISSKIRTGCRVLIFAGQPKTFQRWLDYFAKWIAHRRYALPELTLVHASRDADGLGLAVPFGEWQRRNDCSPDEQFLEARFCGVSMLELGAGLKDKLRPKDLLVLERLIRASRWRLPIAISKLATSLLDPSQFVFACQLARGREEVSAAVVTNTMKRVRQTFTVGGVAGDEIVRYEPGRGYLFDFTKCSVSVIHLPQ
jgi:hypothetical protein